MKNRLFALALAALAAGTLIAADVADARRLGGGRSFGTQRSFTPPPATAPHTPPSAAPSTPSGAASNPVMPAQPGSTLARPAAPAAGAAAAGAAAPRSGLSRWMGPIAGLAAGLGLAALLSHFGLSETFASFLMLALLVVGVVFVLRLVLGRRAPQRNEAYSYAGPATPAPAPQRFEPTFGGGRADAAPAARRLPADFDEATFMREAKLQFKRLQEAYDAADRALLADVVTPEMFNEIARDLDTRGSHRRTEIVALDGEVLDVATERDRHWASVRFHGLTREDGAATPQPFDEVWNLVKPIDGSTGWMLGGIQQLESAS